MMAKLQSRLGVQVNRIAVKATDNFRNGFLNSVLRVTFLYTRTRNFGGGCGLFHVILRREGNDAV